VKSGNARYPDPRRVLTVASIARRFLRDDYARMPEDLRQAKDVAVAENPVRCERVPHVVESHLLRQAAARRRASYAVYLSRREHECRAVALKHAHLALHAWAGHHRVAFVVPEQGTIYGTTKRATVLAREAMQSVLRAV
jgi:hypothetical protein